MSFFLLLILAVLLCFALISFLSPPSSPEEEPELWEATELRLETLLQGALDPHPEVRDSCHNQILSMGPGVILRLINGLSQELCFAQPNEAWCRQVESLLQDFGLQVIPPLLEWLREEGDNPAVAESVCRILRAYDTPALRLILAHLDSTLLSPLSPLLQEWGASTTRLVLQKLRKEPRRKLWHQLLLEVGPAATEGLMEAVDKWTGEAQSQAFFVLARLGPRDARDVFLEALQDSDIHKRMAAVRALERINESELWEALVPLLDDPAREVRALAIQVMAHLGQDAAHGTLWKTWERIRNEPDRLHEALLLAVVLAEFGEPAPVDMIERGLQSDASSHQRLALQLLSYLPAEERLDFLLPLLEHRAESIVAEVIYLLLELRSSYVLERLMQQFVRLPHGHRHARLIENAMMQVDEWAIPYLCQTLNDEQRDPRIHAIALRALLYVGDQRALEPVLHTVHRVHDPEWVWGISPQDMYLFLRRLSLSHPVEPTLQRFIENHPHSPMAPALSLFLEQQKRELPSSLSLRSPSAKIER